MSLMDTLLGQVSDNATVQGLAAKVGLTPDQVEAAVAALAQAHGQEGHTVENAAAATGLPTGALDQIVGHIGGEGSLGRFASIVEEEGGAQGILGGLSKYLGS